MADIILIFVNFGSFLVLLVATYFIGTIIERNHYKSIRAREETLRHMPTVTFRNLPEGWVAADARLVYGSVVISLDYFKRFLAGLRALVGGRIKSYEPLLDRGRREAMLRMKEHAVGLGYDAVINVRLETSRIASTQRKGKGTAGIEMLAFGTAIKRAG